MSHHVHQSGISVDYCVVGAASVVALAGEIPWLPIISLVLVPSARWVGDRIRERSGMAKLAAENEALRVENAKLRHEGRQP